MFLQSMSFSKGVQNFNVKMGQTTYVNVGASASLVVSTSTIPRIRSILRMIRNERLEDELYIGEYREEGGELSVHDYDQFRPWLEEEGEEGEEPAHHLMDAFDKAFGPNPRIVFMHVAKSFHGYGVLDMRNPHIYDEDDESITKGLANLERGKELLGKLGFAEEEINLSYTLREHW
jgi:hypothetical protein